MKVTAIIGSPLKGKTLLTVKRLEQHLKGLGRIDFEYVILKDAGLNECRGCGACLEKGEEFCPLKDGRDDIFKKMMDSDGVIFASPVYSLQVTALMKNFLDRLAYVFHRPCFFHRAFMPVVVQGVYGADGVLKYLDEVARFWGFRTCPGLGLTVAWEKPLPSEQYKNDLEIKKAAGRFYDLLTSQADPVPGLKDVVIFHSMRTVHSIAAGLSRDRRYFEERGWLTAEYFYKTRIGWHKKIAGRWVEKQVKKQVMAAKRERDLKSAAENPA